jgi:acetyltransferase-like isoleucine patch superfamily enzyme
VASGLFSTMDNIFGWYVRRRKRIAIGAGTSVRWCRLGARGDGQLSIGRDCDIRCRVDFDSSQGRIAIGDRCYIGRSHLVCHTGIELGDDVIVSWGVTILDHNSHSLEWSERASDVSDWRRGRKNWDHVAVSPVRIQSRVWIGFGATILKGVTIGEGAVIAARAVVSRDVNPYSVVAGNPAQTVRTLAHGDSKSEAESAGLRPR